MSSKNSFSDHFYLMSKFPSKLSYLYTIVSKICDRTKIKDNLRENHINHMIIGLLRMDLFQIYLFNFFFVFYFIFILVTLLNYVIFDLNCSYANFNQFILFLQLEEVNLFVLVFRYKDRMSSELANSLK